MMKLKLLVVAMLILGGAAPSSQPSTPPAATRAVDDDRAGGDMSKSNLLALIGRFKKQLGEKQAEIDRLTKANKDLVSSQASLQTTVSEQAAEIAKLRASDSAKPSPAEPTVAGGDPSLRRFDVHGIHMGDAVTEEFRRSHCPAKEGSNPTTAQESLDIDGRNVFIMYDIQDRKFIGVSMLFDSMLFEQLLDRFRQKLGEPQMTSADVATRTGVHYKNRIATWTTADGPFVLEKYGPTIEKGDGILSTVAMDKAYKAKEDAAKGKLKSGL